MRRGDAAALIAAAGIDQLQMTVERQRTANINVVFSCGVKFARIGVEEHYARRPSIPQDVTTEHKEIQSCPKRSSMAAGAFSKLGP